MKECTSKENKISGVIFKYLDNKNFVFKETAENYYRNFLPGPVAVVSKSRNKVAPGIEAANQTLGIRIPNYLLILKIIQKKTKRFCLGL